MSMMYKSVFNAIIPSVCRDLISDERSELPTAATVLFSDTLHIGEIGRQCRNKNFKSSFGYQVEIENHVCSFELKVKKLKCSTSLQTDSSTIIAF